MTDMNRIIHGDVLEVMATIPDETFSVILTSPPYNLINTTGHGFPKKGGFWDNPEIKNGYANHDDNMPHGEYVAWQRECLREMFRVLRNDGAIFYNHKWRVQNGLLQDRADIVDGFPVRQVIIWQRSGGINFRPGFFLPTYEVIYLIPKPDFRIVQDAIGHGDIWYFHQTHNNPHPAPFPLALAKRVVNAVGRGPVLDPFCGSGTTCVAAALADMEWVGIDNSLEYVNMARDRIRETTAMPVFDMVPML